MTDIKRIKVFNPSSESLNYYSGWIGKSVDNIDEADVVLFTGNKTLHAVYNSDCESGTNSIYAYANEKEDLDDFIELSKAVKKNIPIIGVNKGMHLIHCHLGYPLVTHMQHPVVHDIEFLNSNISCSVNSNHHQMPFIEDSFLDSKYNLIGFSKDLSPFYINSKYMNYTGMIRDDEFKIIEPEIIYYNEINALGIQFDIHKLKSSATARLICRKLVELMINNEIKEFLDLKIPVENLIFPNFSLKQYKLNKQIELEETYE